MLFLEQYFDQMLCPLTYVGLHSLGTKRGWFGSLGCLRSKNLTLDLMFYLYLR